MISDFPDPPRIPAETFARCAKSGDWRPILFEWYKFVGILTIYVAELSRTSPCFRPIGSTTFAVLRGLLSRCSRLMLVSVHLFCQEQFGETTLLLNRTIVESAVWLRWLCQRDTLTRCTQFMAHSLRTDLLFRDEVVRLMEKRGGSPLKIETRMLDSIGRALQHSGLSEDEARSGQLPSFETACHDLGFDKLFYASIYRMGSHSIHGTWTDLLTNYLELDADDEWQLRDGAIESHVDVFVTVPVYVLAAIGDYIYNVTGSPTDLARLREVVKLTQEQILDIYRQTAESDFRPGEGGASGI